MGSAVARAGRTVRILESNSLVLEKQVAGWWGAWLLRSQVTSSQGESNIRTQDSPASSQELGWSLKARSPRALAPLTLSQDLVSYGYQPSWLLASSFLLAHQRSLKPPTLIPHAAGKPSPFSSRTQRNLAFEVNTLGVGVGLAERDGAEGRGWGR